MSADFAVRWDKYDQAPTVAALRKALRGYLGDLGTIETLKGVLYATLPGKPSNPFGITYRDDERWFEVFRYVEENKKYCAVLVTTRMQDEITNCIARGFASAIARHWQGKPEWIEQGDLNRV